MRIPFCAVELLLFLPFVLKITVTLFVYALLCFRVSFVLKITFPFFFLVQCNIFSRISYVSIWGILVELFEL